MAGNPFATPASPWPLPPATLGTLFTTGSDTRASRLQSRWPLTTGNYAVLTSTSSGWASTQAQATTGFGYALKYLATGTASYATSAYTAATGETFAYDTDAARIFGGSAAYVYAWCKGALSSAQNTTLINQIDSENSQRETNIPAHYLLDGPGNGNVGISGYIFGCIAITGQTLVTGLTDRRTNLRNLVQNMVSYFLETCGDGWWTSYDLLAQYNWWCILAYHIATGETSLLESRFPWFDARSEVLIRMLGPDWTRSWGNPSHNAWYDSSGMDWTSQWPEPAFASTSYADMASNATTKSVAKYHQTQMNNNRNATYANNIWTQLGVVSDCTWLALLFSDDTITPLSPASAGIPMCKAWTTTGVAEFRSGWTETNNVIAQFMCGPAPQNDHNHNKAGSFTLRANGVYLVKNGYVYAGRASPATWEGAVPMFVQEVGGYNMCQSGPLFVPTGSYSTRPDRDASNGAIGVAPSAPANSATKYPFSNSMTGGVRQTWSSGSMNASDWYDDGSLAKMIGTYTDQFQQITSGQATVAYIRGTLAGQSGGAAGGVDTFVIYDQFTVPGTIGYIRRNFWSANKPTISGEVVEAGSSTAGVLTATGNSVVITNGSYQATVQFCTPLDGIDVIGGLSYESYFDGYPGLGQNNGGNYDYMTYAHIADSRTTTSFTWLQGQWRTSFRTTAAIAAGEMLVVISVQTTGSTAPTYTRASALALLTPGVPVAMPGTSQYWNAKLLNATTGKAALTSPTLYAAACSVMGSDAGTGFTEVSGLGYARHQMAAAGGDWNTAVVASPATVTNANDIVWPAATGAWPQIIGVAFWDSLTGGNLITSDFLGSAYWQPFTCAAASPAVITCENHGFTNGQTVAVTTKFGGVLPALSQGAWGGLLTVGSVTTNTFQLTTAGSVVLNASGAGAGSVRLVVPATVPSGNTLRIQAGNQTIAMQ